MISIAYAPHTSIYSDIDEDEVLIDEYSKYNAEFSEGHSLRINPIMPIYIQASRITTDDYPESDADYVDSLTTGLLVGGLQDKYSNFTGYYFFGVGAGLADFRFKNTDLNEKEGIAEVYGETGYMFFEFLVAGAGLKGQYIGYPGETKATSIKFYFSKYKYSQ